MTRIRPFLAPLALALALICLCTAAQAGHRGRGLFGRRGVGAGCYSAPVAAYGGCYSAAYAVPAYGAGCYSAGVVTYSEAAPATVIYSTVAPQQSYYALPEAMPQMQFGVPLMNCPGGVCPR